jgi:hypothetical protein
LATDRQLRSCHCSAPCKLDHFELEFSAVTSLPVAEQLKKAMVSRPGCSAQTTFVNSRRAARTTDGFKTSLFKLIRRLEKEGAIAKGLTFHGLRHTVATELQELGFDTRTIAGMPGQKSESMAMHYSQGADLREKLKPAIEKMEIAAKTRTELSGKSGNNVWIAISTTQRDRPKTLIFNRKVLVAGEGLEPPTPGL